MARKRVDHEADELDSLVNTVWHRGSNNYHNHLRLIDHETAEGNNTSLSEHRNVMGHLEQRGARNLRKSPKISREKGKSGKVGEKVATSDTTGRWLRWSNLVHFEVGKNKRKTKADPLVMSNDSYAYFRTHFDILGLPSKDFNSLFTSRGQKRVDERKQKNLDELVGRNLKELPKKLHKDLQGLVDRGHINNIVELLRYAPELRKGDTEGIRYKRFAGNIINRLHKMLIDDKIDAPEAHVSVLRIKSPYLDADKSDWLIAMACANQYVPMPIDVIFGKEKEDILRGFGLGKNIGFNVDLDRKFRPVRWYREGGLDYEEKSIGQAINGNALTRAEAEGIKRELSGFWKERNSYLRNILKDYFWKGDLEEAAQDMWKVHSADKKHIAEEKKNKKEAHPILHKSAYKVWGEFFEDMEYDWHEAGGHQRKGTLVDSVLKQMTIKDIEENAPKLFVEWKKYLIARDIKDERNGRNVLDATYVPIAGKERKNLLSKIEKIKGSYVRPKGSTNHESLLLINAGFSVGRQFKKVKDGLSMLEQEVGNGILPQRYKTSSLEKAYKVVEDFKAVGKNLRKKIDFMAELQEYFGLEMTGIVADSGAYSQTKSDPKFRIDDFFDVKYVGDRQRKTIEKVYGMLMNNKDVKGLLKQDMQELEELQRKLENVEGDKFYWYLGRAAVDPVTEPLIGVRRNITFAGMTMQDFTVFQQAGRRFKHYTKATEVKGLKEKLEMIGAYLPKDELGYAFDRFAQDCNKEKVWLHKDLITAVDTAYSTLKN